MSWLNHYYPSRFLARLALHYAVPTHVLTLVLVVRCCYSPQPKNRKHATGIPLYAVLMVIGSRPGHAGITNNSGFMKAATEIMPTKH
ncbi:hypothetical protein F5B22DRAFT_591087 [Xylaria bambusicola]|uniref:uncharacterized protein n=1 Tax=Xylaria bambusicola TaxID=326684 RepID=UPI0020073321|nr:uncharacterized protein F5B22DRAFT_591087 [Xylaria bambusicola]KAI0525691.1 hypothetical protein F5B22DRAFT_591087 [Xylaria bambusicola]